MTHSPLRPRASLLRHLHARQILAALQQFGPMSRAGITRQTGISGPTVTRTVNDLLGEGLLEEGELDRTAAGRPGTVLRLANERVSVLGLVVGVAACELVVGGVDGTAVASPEPFPTPGTYAALLAAVVERAEPLIAGGDPEVLGLGVSVPGLLNSREGRTVVSPNLHQTDGQRLGADLQAALGVEVAAVQESKALCLAEMACGEARGVADFAMLDITDGLGLGVVHNGRILEGHRGLAGELGHITVKIDGPPCGCGNRGCLETLATDAALAHAVSARLGRAVTMDELLIGEIKCANELDGVLQYLAVGLAAVVNVFNPERLFIYGRLLDLDPDVLPRLTALTAERALVPSMADCQIIRARGDKRRGALAAIVHRLTGAGVDY